MVASKESYQLPRLIIAAPASGQGKTTVAMGLMAALTASGTQVAGFKVGPDYIDPGYHQLACGRPGRNLDPYLCGSERIAPLFAHGALAPITRPHGVNKSNEAKKTKPDISIIEGVMGLFDGKLGAWPDGSFDLAGFGSTAHIARLLDAPIILVVDGSHSARTAAALCHGLATYDSRLNIAGIIVNRVMSPRVIDELRRASACIDLPILGAIPPTKDVGIDSRHLGLITAAEHAHALERITQAGDLIARHVDLDAVVAIARQAAPLTTHIWNPQEEVERVADGDVIAMAAGPAFTFSYTETVELLEAAGCRIAFFDPLVDDHLPAHTAGLYIGGGFPEEHAEALARNTPLHAEIRHHIAAGLPTVAECAGFLYLCNSLDGLPMVGALDSDAVMTSRLTMGYHEATASADNMLTSRGETFHTHEFHRTTVRIPSTQPSDSQKSAWKIGDGTEGIIAGPHDRQTDLDKPWIHASYQHLHWAGSSHLAQRFALAAHNFQARSVTLTPQSHPESDLVGPPDLRHHGDSDAIPGLTDLAVNVRDRETPQWLVDVITTKAAQWARYPDSREATEAIAHRHGVSMDQVLVTAGVSEAFSLVARVYNPRWALVVHPQFTEPEAALRQHHRHVGRLILRPENDFHLDPSAVDDRADLVVVGNPTNPTGVLHPRKSLLALRKPGRIVLTDEAFMDCAADQSQSLIGPDMAGIIVARSLTKTWSIPGLRIGYIIGDPALIAQLREEQPCWPVSSPALAAAVACSNNARIAMAEQRRQELAEAKADLISRLAAIGVRTVPGDCAAFLLADLRAYDPAALRDHLNLSGFAVRGCETFPGLGPGWLRLAIRDCAINASFTAALARATTVAKETLT